MRSLGVGLWCSAHQIERTVFMHGAATRVLNQAQRRRAQGETHRGVPATAFVSVTGRGQLKGEPPPPLECNSSLLPQPPPDCSCCDWDPDARDVPGTGFEAVVCGGLFVCGWDARVQQGHSAWESMCGNVAERVRKPLNQRCCVQHQTADAH